MPDPRTNGTHTTDDTKLLCIPGTVPLTGHAPFAGILVEIAVVAEPPPAHLAERLAHNPTTLAPSQPADPFAN